jgi:hypothetical protein
MQAEAARAQKSAATPAAKRADGELAAIFEKASPVVAARPTSTPSSEQPAPGSIEQRAAALPAERPATTTASAFEAEDPRHQKARRLARLLVGEIKLYNEQDVADGRRAGDLYVRLKESIDLSLENYRQRVPEEVRAQFDYLYDELLRQLAEGDAKKLGQGAPGPQPPR